jgi:crotonobetainyl-CoA:carnitine CoA-transferase CaiB-like acyl-CoA transferase
LLEIERIGDAAPRLRPLGTRPLSGIRVLDLTRIIAGPVAGRTLAAHGADVLNISSPHLPSIPSLVIDTGRGKRAAHVDLKTLDGVETLRQLVRNADVFIQGYRPGGLAARGFSEHDLLALKPGIVAVSLSAYGHVGPWANRRGFDSLTQNANGLNWEEAQAASADGRVDRPKELPAQALDHVAGHVLAFGATMALARQMTEGGSWRVRTSLAQVGHWLQSLPRVAGGPKAIDPTGESIADLLETTPSGFGPLTAVRHAALLSATPARWALPSMPLCSHAAAWG